MEALPGETYSFSWECHRAAHFDLEGAEDDETVR